MSVFYKERAVKGARTIFPKVVIKNLRQFPYPAAIRTDKKKTLAAHAQRMLDLHSQLADAKTEHAKTNLQRQIDATDAQIDKLVYELYELTPDEIKIVEAAAR